MSINSSFNGSLLNTLNYMLQLPWTEAWTYIEDHDGQEAAWTDRKCFGEGMGGEEAGLGVEIGIPSLGWVAETLWVSISSPGE